MYESAAGALANVAAHSRARNVKIVLASRRDTIVMKVEDDGKGFDVPTHAGETAALLRLRTMRDRIELLGGTIRLHFPARPPPHVRRTALTTAQSLRSICPLHEIEAT